MATKKKTTPAPDYLESDAWHTKTHQLWEQGHLGLAFRRFLTAAKRVDPIAQLNLGYFYDLGIGVSRKRSVALFWYKRAYLQGYCTGANNAGTIYRDMGDFVKALMWFERAVLLGDGDANWEIAKMYFRQRKDRATTILYLKRVISAKPYSEVSKWSHEAAARLLWRLERPERSVA